MNRRFFEVLNRRNCFITVLTAIVMIFLLAGYATAANIFGTLDRNRDLDNMFRNYEVLQDYNYFTSGGYDVPNAILLIKKGYVLENPKNLWKPIPIVDYGQMRKWVSVISSDEDFNRKANYFAAYILDQNGNRVGVWYSVEPFATVKFLGGDRVLVYTPDLFYRFSILGDI